MRVLLTGASGQLGRALGDLLGGRVAWSGGREALDVRDFEAVSRQVAESQPDVVINGAAYNNVDGAETEVAEALAVNVLGPRNLARACQERGALLVHISTDYVFDGQGDRPYTEEDVPRPLNAYGASKLAGELMVTACGCSLLLIRTSGVFGAGGSRTKGGSFVERILERARAGQPLCVVNDQVFSPTYAPDLARAILALLERGARGLYHVTNAGSCSWHDLAVAAVAKSGLRVAVEPIPSATLRSAARRPAYSVLATDRYRALGLFPLRPWEEALAEFLSA